MFMTEIVGVSPKSSISMGLSMKKNLDILWINPSPEVQRSRGPDFYLAKNQEIIIPYLFIRYYA